MVTRYTIPTDLAPVDTSYANYLRLCDVLLITGDHVMANNNWNWLEDKASEIRRLMNLSEVRDRPESTGEASW